MLSLEQIQDISREAALRAAEENQTPYYIDSFDIQAFKQGNIKTLRSIPFLGDYLPPGFQRLSLEGEYDLHPHGIYMGDNDGYGAYFVDATGWGERGEAALTIKELIERLRPGYYAIVVAGEFQVKIGAFSTA
jgi:hypothetical protein